MNRTVPYDGQSIVMIKRQTVDAHTVAERLAAPFGGIIRHAYASNYSPGGVAAATCISAASTLIFAGTVATSKQKLRLEHCLLHYR